MAGPPVVSQGVSLLEGHCSDCWTMIKSSLWSSQRRQRGCESEGIAAPLPLQSNLAGCWCVSNRRRTNNGSALVNNNVCARSLSWGQSSAHKAHLASIRCPEMLFSTSVFILPSFSAKVLSGFSIPCVGQHLYSDRCYTTKVSEVN